MTELVRIAARFLLANSSGSFDVQPVSVIRELGCSRMRLPIDVPVKQEDIQRLAVSSAPYRYSYSIRVKSYRLGFSDRALSFYGGVGANRIDPHFQVGFTDQTGNVDNTQVQLENPVVRAALFGGVTEVLRQIFDVGVQVYSVPQDATLFRLMGGIRVR